MSPAVRRPVAGAVRWIALFASPALLSMGLLAVGAVGAAGCSSGNSRPSVDAGLDGSPSDGSADAPGDDAGERIRTFCNDDDAEQWTAEAAPGAHCEVQSRIATVTVQAQGTGQWSAFATLLDSMDPRTGPPALADAQCAFFEYAPGDTCVCDEEEVCTYDNRCERRATPVTPSTLTLAGNGDGEETLTDDGSGTLYGTVSLDGETVALELNGCALRVTPAATAPPDALTGLSGTLEGGYEAPEAVDITWDAVEPGSQVHTRVPINHHVGGPTFTECVVDASSGSLHIDGAMLVPLAVVTGLEFQGISHVRFAAAETPYGCVEFRFETPAYVDLAY